MGSMGGLPPPHRQAAHMVVSRTPPKKKRQQQNKRVVCLSAFLDYKKRGASKKSKETDPHESSCWSRAARPRLAVLGRVFDVSSGKATEPRKSFTWGSPISGFGDVVRFHVYRFWEV